MKLLALLVGIFVLVQGTLLAQHGWYTGAPPSKNRLEIRSIIIENKQLQEGLQRIIKQQTDSNSLFRDGYGYLRVDQVEFPPRKPYFAVGVDSGYAQWANDTLIRLQVEVSSIALLEQWESDGFLSDYYPPYYTFVDKRLVLLYDRILGFYGISAASFTSKSKKKLRSLMYPFLKHALKESFVFRRLDSKLFRLSKEERTKLTQKDIFKEAAFSLSAVYTVSILSNGAVHLKSW